MIISYLCAVAVSSCFAVAASPRQSAEAVDSLLARIGLEKDASERLDAYSDVCAKAATWEDPGDAIRLFRSYQAEASRQGDAGHEAEARTFRLYEFYNRNMPDSLEACLDDDLRFFERHGDYEAYYSCWSLRVERLSYDGRLQSALHEAKAMYDDAIGRKSVYGRGMSAYLIATSYQGMSRDKEAVDYFIEAERCLLEKPNVGQLHNLYGMAWQSLSTVGRYDDVLKMVERWERMWNDYCSTNRCGIDDIAGYYIVCLLAKAHVCMKQGDMATARKELDRASDLAETTGHMSRQLYLKEEAIYSEIVGDYDAALAFVEERRLVQNGFNNRAGMMETDECRARLLSRMGRFEEAAGIYEGLIARKDSLSYTGMAAQLDDMALVYGLDKAKAEKDYMRLWMIAAFSLCGLLMLLGAGFVLYKRMEKHKDKAIGKALDEKLRAERQVRVLMRKLPEDSLDKDGRTFMRLNNLLEDATILTDPDLKREAIARMLGCNRNAVAAAIKNCSGGMEVMAYVNRMRVKYACELMTKEGNLTVRMLAERCGFNSHATFIRAFREYTGMTPANYYKSIPSLHES